MSPTSTRETEIVVDTEVPMIRIIREFDAPPAAVFRAHVDPDLVAQWMGPSRLRTRIERWDATTGGSWAYTSLGEPGEEYGFHGSFHDVRPSEVIVQTFTFDGVPDSVALERLVLAELPGGRTRLVATSLVESFEARDAFVASGMESGVVEGYRRLDDLLAPA